MQKEKRFTVRLQLAGHVYPALQIVGREVLSMPFYFEVTVLSESHYQDIDKLLLFPAILSFINPAQGERCIAGIVTQVRCVECQTQQAAKIKLVIEPRMVLLKLHSESRIFCGKSEKEIVSLLLEQHGYHSAQLDFHLIQKSIPKNYRLQMPDESDFDFIDRILANAGIYYWFEEANGREQVHFADINYTNQQKINLAYKALQGDSQLDACLVDLRWQHRLMPEQTVVRDFYEEDPNSIIRGSTGTSDNIVQDYFGLGCYNCNVALQKARFIHEQQQVFASTWYAKSQSIRLQVGRQASVEMSDFAFGADQDLMVFQVRHFYNASSKNYQHSYYNISKFIPFTTPFRPPLKFLPDLPLLFNGKINAPKDSDVLDQQGRYFLHFLFKTTQYGKMPAWRCIMPFGGMPSHQQNVGWHMPLASGTEVLLNHFNNDPDRPCILGACYNADHSDPVTTKNNKHHLLKTAAGHALLFDETDGYQQIKISTPFDYNTVVLHAGKDEPNISITSLAGNVVLSANTQLSIHTDSYIQEDCANLRDDHANQGVLVITKKGEIHYQTTHDLMYEAEEMKVTAHDSISLSTEKQINIECQQMQVQAKNIALDGEILCIKAKKECLFEMDELLQCGSKGVGLTIAADGAIQCYGHEINFSGEVSYQGLILDEMGAKPMPAIKIKKITEPLALGELCAQYDNITPQEDLLCCAIDHDIEQCLPIYQSIRDKTFYIFHNNQGQAINKGKIEKAALQGLVTSLQQTIILRAKK